MGCKLYYSSVKFIKVQHNFLAILYYVAQILLLAYVVVYQIWWKGGYQKLSPFEGAVDIKVKGAGYLGDVDNCIGGPSPGVNWPNCGPYDMSDTSVPPQQEGAVFVATSFYTTPNQTRGFCPSKAPCSTNDDCTKGVSGTGSSVEYLTGTCDTAAGFCTQAAWCPPEVPKKVLNREKHNLTDTNNFTIFFRVDGSFSSFEDKIFSTGDDLVWNYNLFYLSDLISYSQGVNTFPFANISNDETLVARPNMSAFDNVVGDGTVIFLAATILANGSSIKDPKPCNLDRQHPDCLIQFSFTRVDPADAESASFGYNYRFTNPWSLATTGSRSLTKVYGTRIVFQVGGEGGQFNLMSLTIAIGSGIGILSVAKVVCDFILQYLCSTYHPKYTRRKYEVVVEKPGEALTTTFGVEDEEDPEHAEPVDKTLLMSEVHRKRKIHQNGEIDAYEDIAFEKVGCWKMCQVRLCC